MDGARDPLAEAEARRAVGDWRGAAAAYAAHLARRTDDWPIWVQHGHCVKEAGDTTAALASYRRAEAGMPEDADLQIQIGHALKLAGDLAGARRAYGRAQELDPAGDSAWRELTGLLAGAAPEPEGLSLVGDLRLVFDISDLMSWFGSARAPSGIQRIQMELAGAALAPDARLAEARLAVFRPVDGTWRELPREAFRRLCALARAGADAADEAWTATRGQAEALLAAMPALAFPEGAWLVNLGTSWWLPGYHQAVREARARHRLRYAALVHDTGPVSIPEHSEPAVSARFARWFAVLVTQADLLLAVSDATRQDMLRLAGECLPGLPLPPVRVLRPDAALPPPPAAAPHARATALAAEPFVLFVGTIESRKDHLFVLNAWLDMLRRHGAALPPLVLVGREGFNAAPALALLKRAPALEGRVIWLDDVPDGALESLYRRALFTLYHSQHEGWGLPVTEALAAGKAVVTPGHSGMLEAGQGLALHFTPGSEPEFRALVERLLFEPGFRQATEARVRDGLRLRSWRAVAEELLDLLAAAPPAPISPAAPPLGLVHRLAEIDAPRPEPAMAWSELLRAGGGWQQPEGWGCWTKPGLALLRLPLPGGLAGPLRLHLALRGTQSPRRVALRADRGARQMVEIPADARLVIVLELPAPGEIAELAIETADEEGDAPKTGIGVAALMACRPEDLEARLHFLERLTFIWPGPG